MAIKNTDLAYMAGYIDGEGCIRMDKYSLRLGIQTCNPYPLRFIVKLFPQTQVRLQNRQTNRNKPIYRLEYSGINAINILKAILPYMIEKKDQAEKLIQIHHLKQELKEAKHRKH